MEMNNTDKLAHYELLYIINNKYTEDELAPIMENVKKIISNNGGIVTYTEEWGKKRLAYSIKNFSHGYFVLVEFDLEESGLKKINDTLRMSNEVLRHMIVIRKQRSTEEIKAEKIKAEEREAKAIKAKQEEIEKEEKIVPKKDKSKMDLKDLDEKLDKILDTDDLL